MGAFGKLPELLGRNFIIGFFLPAFLLLFAIYLTLGCFSRRPDWMVVENIKDFFDAAIIVFITWITAVALLATNRIFVRTLEGYTFQNLYGFQWLSNRRKKSFRGRIEPILALQEKINNARRLGTPEPDRGANFASRLRQAVESHPHLVDHVLPTKFGNRYRAIEIYSYVVYGLDAIPAWPIQ